MKGRGERNYGGGEDKIKASFQFHFGLMLRRGETIFSVERYLGTLWMQVAENRTGNGLSKRTYWLKSPEVSLALRRIESRGSSPLPPQAPLLSLFFSVGYTHGGFPWGGPHSSQLSSFSRRRVSLCSRPHRSRKLSLIDLASIICRSLSKEVGCASA